ncbi:MAG: D-alanyl-D-alanine carboxypeptidase [Actinomycetota bacterium]|nr:D-alanyl-D-alanine carboxypeptidase [Actinomycetota bacterium]
MRALAAPVVAVVLAAVSACGISAAAAASDPAPGARAAVLVEQSTGQRLFARAADQGQPVASATKLMTALVTLEHVHRLSTVFTQNLFYPAAVDSQIGLVPGERMSVHDLLLALMLPSADDAAEDLAYNVGHGSVGRFVAMMNTRARQLGLNHTHYSTPIGLDTAGNFSSAGDLVRLAIFLREHSPFFTRIVALPRAVLHTGSQVRVVLNRNALVGRVPWINGVKTGHTLGAGYVLVASATRGNMTLLSVVLGTDSETARDQSTLALLGYGFGHFRLAHPVTAGAVLAQPTVQDRPGVRAKLVAAAGFSRAISRSERVSLQVRAPATLAGPLARRSAHGYVRILVDGHPVGRVALLLAQPLAAVSPVTIAARFLLRGPTLVGLLALCGAGAALAGVWRRRSRDRQQPGPVQA